MTIPDTAINEKLDKYFRMTEHALSLVGIAPSSSATVRAQAEDLLMMAKSYFADANHFRKQGDLLTALAAVSYAHAWLDAGARMHLFVVDNSSNLFTVD